jgi:hypothetical protein
MQCDVERTEHHQKSSAKNMQSNEWPFKSQTFCRVCWTLNSGAKGLQLKLYLQQDKCLISQSYKLTSGSQSSKFTASAGLEAMTYKVNIDVDHMLCLT